MAEAYDEANETNELSVSHTITTSGVIDRVWREDGKLFVEYTNVPRSPLDDLIAAMSPEERERHLPLAELIHFRPSVTITMEVPPIEYEPKIGDALAIVADEHTIIKWRLRDGPWLPWRALWENGQVRITSKQEQESE